MYIAHLGNDSVTSQTDGEQNLVFLGGGEGRVKVRMDIVALISCDVIWLVAQG